ncbi:hypothetical protein Tco_1405120 [Tanacetum coccineum]
MKYGVEVRCIECRSMMFPDVFDCIKARHHVCCLCLCKEINNGGCHFLGRDHILAVQEADNLWQISTTKADMLQLLIAVGKKISMDLRMDRCSAGKFYSSMVSERSIGRCPGNTYIILMPEFIAGLATLREIIPLMPAMLARAAVDQAPLPEGNTSGSAEDSMQLKELMVLVLKLVNMIGSLEKELNETKQTLGNAMLKLVKKVKTLETALKRKSKKVLISESEGEESEDQGRKFQDIDGDPLVSLVRESMKEKSIDFFTPTKASREAQEEAISPTILEAAKTLSKVASQGVSKEKSTDKGKRYKRRARYMAKKIDIGLDVREEVNTGREKINTGIEEASYKAKEQMRQEQAGLEEAIKLQAQLDEEVAKQIHLDKMIAQRMEEEEALTEQQKKRKAEVQFEAQFYTKEDWDTIRAKLEANAEFSKDMLGQDLPVQDFAKRMVDMMNQRKKHFAEERAKAKRNKPMTQFDDKDVPAEEDKVAEVKEEESMYGTNRPEDAYDRVLWSDLRTMFDPTLFNDATRSLPLQQKIDSWRYYDKCEVHCLTLKACTIYMLADRKYPVVKRCLPSDAENEAFGWKNE